MHRPLDVVLLAGRIRPSPLSESLDVPALCLPIGRDGLLLDAWMRALAGLPNLRRIIAVVNTEEEVRFTRSIAGDRWNRRSQSPTFDIIAEPAPWRGAAGIVRDVIEQANSNDDAANHTGAVDGDTDDGAVLICEAKRLPPRSIEQMLTGCCGDGSADVTGVVGVCGTDEPAGVYLFARRALRRIPRIGYHDLKEQFIPALRQAGKTVISRRVGNEVWRVGDLESYLACVQHTLAAERRGDPRACVSAEASIAPTALLEGHCIVQAGAVIEDNAVVHNSVILWGATIGENAVVSRSVVGSLAIVPAHGRIVGAVRVRERPERAAPSSLLQGWRVAMATVDESTREPEWATW